MNTASFSIKEAVGFGWAMVKEKFLLLIALFVVSAAFAVMPDMAAEMTDNPVVFFFAQVVSIVASFVIDAGLIYVMLSLYDGKKTEISDVFSQYPITFRYFVANMAYGFMVIIGLLLLVFPGVYLALRYQFYKYFLVDKQMDIVDSFKESAKITDGHKWHLLRFALVIAGINFLGLIALFIGLFVTIPLSMLAAAYVYRKLSAPVGETESVKEAKDFLEAIEKSAPGADHPTEPVAPLSPIE